MTATATSPLLIVVGASDALTAAGCRVQYDERRQIWQIRLPRGEWLELDGEALIAAAPLVTARPQIAADDLVAALGGETPDVPPAPALPEGRGLVALALIDDNPYQPRLAYDAERITAIADSIRTHGLLQTPLARRIGDRFQLAFGHSRLRAFQQLAESNPARFGQMPLVIRELDDETMALHAWIENRDRKDLTAYEEACAIQRNMQAFGWTQATAAQKLQLDRSTVANKLRLLKLPAAALDQLRAGALSERQAAALLPLAELPAELLTRTREQWRERGVYLNWSAGDLMSESETDSGALRKRVDEFLERATIPLQGQPWATRDTGAAPVHATLCKECPVRLKSANRCPDRGCAGNKLAGYGVQQASAAAASLKLPAVARPAGTKPHQDWCDGLEGVQRSAIKEMAATKGCGNLGVVYDGERTWGYGQKLEKYPRCYLVCAHGAGKRCACKAALARDTARPEASEDAKKRLARKRVRAELVPAAEQALIAALAAPTPATWRALLTRIDSSAARKLPDDADTGAIWAALVGGIAQRALGYTFEHHPDYDSAQRSLARLLAEFGLPTPWPAEAPAPPEPPPADVRAQTPAGDDAPALGTAGWITQQLARIEAALAAGRAWPELAGDLQALGEDLEQLAEQLDDATYEDLARRIDAALDAAPGESEAAS